MGRLGDWDVYKRKILFRFVNLLKEMVKCTSFIAIMFMLLTSNTDAFNSKSLVGYNSSDQKFSLYVIFVQDPQFIIMKPSVKHRSADAEDIQPQHLILIKPPSYKQMTYNMQPQHQTGDPSGFTSENLIKVSKRNPACIRRCLGRKVLHPAQCHYVC